MDFKSPPSCPNIVTVRRNPPRRARPTPSSIPPQDVMPPPSSSKSNQPDITPFPIQEIISMEIPQNPQPPGSENLKVYIRIRPLPHPKATKEAVDQNIRLRHKNAWPQNPNAKKNCAKEKTAKKKNSEVCITVNDSQSVTLSPPPALQDSKRIKSVVYEGFSHVFASDASQSGIYEKMVKPLVEDFLNGKSGMLAALGPSGSGKTHTVFGTVREPGMVPLALQHIFKQTQESGSTPSRSFSISIFEIHSEGGKAEKILDLSPDGADLSMQQSTIKGLQEVAIKNAEQAESLIASAMLKRATAMTNTNSQSSRSQCIINIHSFVGKSNRELDVQPKNAVLTIVDLAGAEREKRTGNQGSRLLESNFINNTSMVFGLCLRSLLEHQKNPKKPLQKHFQNSSLTRYLRDYLEGKKRMALILTVKPGEEDYLDTAYLLRQASPYMKIKFNNVEEQPSSVHQKRRIQSFSRVEEPKRKKYCGLDAQMIEEGKCTEAEDSQSEESNANVADAPKITNLDTVNISPIKTDCTDLRSAERNYHIMQNFAKAIWNVLREYNEKHRVAEKEIKSLQEDLRCEKTRYLELEKEYEVFKSFCTCSTEISLEATFLKVDNDMDIPVYLDGNEWGNVHEMTTVKEFNCDNSPTMCNLLEPEKDEELFSEADVNSYCPYLKASECAITQGDQDGTNEMNATILSRNVRESKCCSTPRCGQDISTLADVNGHSHNHKASQRTCTPRCDQNAANQMDAAVLSPGMEASKCSSSPRCNLDIPSLVRADVSIHSPDRKGSKCTSIPGADQHVTKQMDATVLSPNFKISKCSSTTRCDQDNSSLMDVNILSSDLKASDSNSEQDQDSHREDNRKPLDLPLSHKKDAAVIEQSNPVVPDCEITSNASGKSSNVKKPRRRLMPASSILLRDITALGIEDESEKPKGNRGGKKLAADERTLGSISLVRLLQSNLRL